MTVLEKEKKKEKIIDPSLGRFKVFLKKKEKRKTLS